MNSRKITNESPTQKSAETRAVGPSNWLTTSKFQASGWKLDIMRADDKEPLQHLWDDKGQFLASVRGPMAKKLIRLYVEQAQCNAHIIGREAKVPCYKNKLGKVKAIGVAA